MTALGIYYAPEHSRQQDRDYIAALQPRVIRILDPDVQHIADMHALAPNAIIAPRTWVIDDNNGAAVRNLMADPVGTGYDHASQYAAQWDRWINEARQRGLRLPQLDHILFNAANEPNQGGTPDKIATYNLNFLQRCTELGIRAAVLCLGVGWPDNTGPDTPVNWTPYAELPTMIKRNGGMLELHEYNYKTGPQDGWRWLAGRHLQCPFDVQILLGEIGVDNYVDAARWQKEGGNRGWQGNVSPDLYAEMIEYHIRNSDRRVVAALPFITDYRSNAWESFDTAQAHNALLARKDRMIPQAAPSSTPTKSHEVRLPSVIGPTPALPPAKVPMLAHPVADPKFRFVTQPFGARPEYYSQFSVDGVPLRGHNGIDFGTPEGTPIVAVDDGQVVEAEYDADGYGTYVKIRHSWGESLYAHLSNRITWLGAISKGNLIGLSGNTGNSTGPHLHFGLRVNPFNRADGWGGFVDPASYLIAQTAPAPIIGAKEIVKVIALAALEFNVDSDLLLSQAWAESSFNPNAVSGTGAKGLMQIMDATWAEWSAKIVAGDNPFDARQNARVGAAYLSWLLRQTRDFEFDALVAYGWGIGNWLNNPDDAPEIWLNYANKIIHGRDLLKAVGG